MTTSQNSPHLPKPATGNGNWAGAIMVGESVSLPGIWNSLHVSADAVITLTELQAPAPEIDVIDRSDLYLLALLRQVESERWIALCNAAGWTSYGAIALSWCAGANMDLVGRSLRATGTPFTLDPVGLRPARFLNPELRPQSGSLTALIDIANSSSDVLALLIATCPVPVVIDVTERMLENLSPDTRYLLAQKATLGCAG